jgi:hypothetical protein
MLVTVGLHTLLSQFHKRQLLTNQHEGFSHLYDLDHHRPDISRSHQHEGFVPN